MASPWRVASRTRTQRRERRPLDRRVRASPPTAVHSRWSPAAVVMSAATHGAGLSAAAPPVSNPCRAKARVDHPYARAHPSTRPRAHVAHPLTRKGYPRRRHRRVVVATPAPAPDAPRRPPAADLTPSETSNPRESKQSPRAGQTPRRRGTRRQRGLSAPPLSL
jgi:hypothetical protein